MRARRARPARRPSKVKKAGREDLAHQAKLVAAAALSQKANKQQQEADERHTARE